MDRTHHGALPPRSGAVSVARPFKAGKARYAESPRRVSDG